MSTPEPPQVVTITIDGLERQVPAGELLIQAAQDHGTYIPRFCWHERMKPVGMCRMCLVQVETPRGPAIITACTNTVADGMVVDTLNHEVKKAQEAILEFLLANHPLDCPVCDKGGECPLQDQTLAYGPGESRFVEIKRTFEKPIPISALVLLDRERCILCARCTRFSDEISGDPLIEFKERGDRTEVNTFPDLPFSSYFSGNTVQICPVGALTARPYRFKARPWDLERVESSSLFDTAHPRIEVHASQNRILRFVGVDNPETNHGWLSDKARFGYEYLDSEGRVTMPLVRRGDGEFEAVGWREALEIVANRLDLIKSEDGGDALAVIGGAQGTNEDAYALSKFARVALGTNNLDCRIDHAISSHLLAATVDRARIDDLDDADTILVWGPDLKEEHPTLYLRVRRAAQELGVKLVVVHPRKTGLDDRATLKVEYRPGGGFGLLDQIADGDRPELSGMLTGKVVALIGAANLADGPRLVESVAAYVRQTAAQARVLPLISRANSYGALDMGVAPDLLPGRMAVDPTGVATISASWGDIPVKPGRDTAAILEGLVSGDVRALLLVGADPVGDFPDSRLTGEAFDSVEYLISIDTFIHDSNRDADVILPASSLTESEGTVTNCEGRVQKVNQIRPAPGQARSDRAILSDMASLMGYELGLGTAEIAAKEIAAVAPAYRGVTWDALEWDHRQGVVVPMVGSQPLTYIPVVLAGNRPSEAALTLHAARVMYDNGVRLRNSPSLAPLGPGAIACVSPVDAPGLGVGDGATVRLVTKTGEGEYTAVIDVGTPAGVVYVPLNQLGARSLGTDPVVRVSVVG